MAITDIQAKIQLIKEQGEQTTSKYTGQIVNEKLLKPELDKNRSGLIHFPSLERYDIPSIQTQQLASFTILILFCKQLKLECENQLKSPSFFSLFFNKESEYRNFINQIQIEEEKFIEQSQKIIISLKSYSNLTKSSPYKECTQDETKFYHNIDNFNQITASLLQKEEAIKSIERSIDKLKQDRKKANLNALKSIQNSIKEAKSTLDLLKGTEEKLIYKLMAYSNEISNLLSRLATEDWKIKPKDIQEDWFRYFVPLPKESNTPTPQRTSTFQST